MNKKGDNSSLWGTILAFIVAILAVSFAAVSYYNTDIGSQYVDNAPQAISTTYQIVVSVASPIVEGLYFVVAPAGQDENVRMIAFAVFMLLTLVGYKSLRPFLGKSSFLPFVVSLIVGIIAGRSLTATVLKQTALGASPIAAVSLILGFLPIYAITKNIDKWGINQWSKLVVFVVASVVYILTFIFAFGAPGLGWTYGVGILFLGAIQTVTPWFNRIAREERSENLGRYMAGVQQTVQTVEGMQRGASS